MVGFLACDKFKAYDYDLISEFVRQIAREHMDILVRLSLGELKTRSNDTCGKHQKPCSGVGLPRHTPL